MRDKAQYLTTGIMVIQRPLYLQKLISRRHNGMIKIVTGIRRCGKSFEVDFVCNMGSRRYYIQSAYRMPDEEKMKQEEASLLNIDDSFKKIIIIGEDTPVLRNEAGITTIGIYDFLLNENSLDL